MPSNYTVTYNVSQQVRTDKLPVTSNLSVQTERKNSARCDTIKSVFDV